MPHFAYAQKLSAFNTLPIPKMDVCVLFRGDKNRSKVVLRRLDFWTLPDKPPFEKFAGRRLRQAALVS
jgi:hypothetical protein